MVAKFADRVKTHKCEPGEMHPASTKNDCAIRTLAHVMASIDGRDCGGWEQEYYDLALLQYREQIGSVWWVLKGGTPWTHIYRAIAAWGGSNVEFILNPSGRFYGEYMTYNQIVKSLATHFPERTKVVLRSRNHVWYMTRAQAAGSDEVVEWIAHDWGPGARTRILGVFVFEEEAA